MGLYVLLFDVTLPHSKAVISLTVKLYYNRIVSDQAWCLIFVFV